MGGCWLQAVFNNAADGKLGPALVADKAVVKAMAKDPPSQMAQLIALEHYLTVTAPAQQSQVRLRRSDLDAQLNACSI